MPPIFLGLLLAAGSVIAHPVVDDRGREWRAGPVQRIVTLAPHLAELVHEAGAGDLLVGTVAFSDHPPAVATLPKVGDAFRIDLERLASLQPDLVVAWLGGNPQTAIEEIERLGFPVVALHADRLEDISRHLRLLGTLSRSGIRAREAADRFDARLAALIEAHAGARRVRVFYQVAARPLFTIGGGHSLDHAISVCGGENVFGGLDAVAPSVAVEAVIGADPEVIVGGVFPYPADDPGELEMWLRWSGIHAVKAGHLYQLDAGIMGRPTPRLLDGVVLLCERIARARR